MLLMSNVLHRNMLPMPQKMSQDESIETPRSGVFDVAVAGEEASSWHGRWVVGNNTAWRCRADPSLKSDQPSLWQSEL